jgi:putative zinc finger protein
MKCLRFDIARRLTAYLDGELDDRATRRVEAHLLDCLDCRARLMTLREGRSFALRLARTAPRRDPWDAIEAAIDAAPEEARPPRARRPARLPAWLPHTALGRAGWAVALALVVVNAFMFVRRAPDGHDIAGSRVIAATFDRDDFHAVEIADIRENTRPHIVAEGRVAEVRYDEEDGNLTFTLVDDERTSSSFVVCEMIQPLQFAPPPVGSRVRVYGVSRFDNEADHRWYEIHPVLGIETLPSQ